MVWFDEKDWKLGDFRKEGKNTIQKQHIKKYELCVVDNGELFSIWPNLHFRETTLRTQGSEDWIDGGYWESPIQRYWESLEH